MNEPWTVKKILDWTIAYFDEKSVTEPRLSAEWLLASVLSCQRVALYVQFERILTIGERTAYRELVMRRAGREPVQYILGETEFYGLPIRVTPEVLIPRPDTEILVDSVIEWLHDTPGNATAILDIGTGSGCIAIALAKAFPDVTVTAIDNSEAALAIARENAQRNQVRIDFIHGDFFALSNSLDKPFDVIVSNPPYIAASDWDDLQPEVRSFEPQGALLAGKDGLDFYRRLCPLLPGLLGADGAVFLEVGYNQAHQVSSQLSHFSFYPATRKDYARIDRVVSATRIPTAKRTVQEDNRTQE